MTIWRPMRNICLALPERLLIEIDEAAKEEYMNRSEYIRKVLKEAVAPRNEEAIKRAAAADPFDPRLFDLDDS